MYYIFFGKLIRRTLQRTTDGIEPDIYDWVVLLSLIDSFLLFGRKKWLRDKLLVALFNLSPAEHDMYSKQILCYIAKQFIIVAQQKEGRIERVKLFKR